MRRGIATRLAFAVLWLALAGCGASLLPTLSSDADRLAVARRLYDEAHYTEAAELLKTYIAANAGGAMVDEAIHLLGSTYLKQREWTLASGEFERLLRDYPESDSSGSAAFRLGEALAGQTRPRDFDQVFTVRAVEQWRSYLRGYPGHWLNAEAERRIQEARTRLAEKLVDTGTLYLKLDLPEPARAYFRKVTEEYPDTTATPYAAIGIALCDAQEGKRERAIAQLREVEARYPGQRPAEQAARERARLERH
ncbi:MAG TPA: outer membrane protein assembly factor BamD [Candidatus Limnocylindria bacterium]|nr:outer membrane protein assembly factor BamD [Candidatus Limnocylindria bacterium]